MEILYEYVPAIMEWCETYMKKEPTSGSGEIEFKRYNVVHTIHKLLSVKTAVDPPTATSTGLVTAATRAALQ